MKKILFTIVLVCPMATWAQDIKPFDAKLGLWESTSTTEISGMPATPATPAMPALTARQDTSRAARHGGGHDEGTRKRRQSAQQHQ